MTYRTLLRTLSRSSLGLLSLMLVACGDGGADPDCTSDPSAEVCSGRSYVQGRVTDGSGHQTRRIGGEGTVSAVSMVTASTVLPNGSLATVAEADVAADGSYLIDVPANREALVMSAVDASGDVIASAVLERSAPEDGTTDCTPMNSESSLEAEVFTRMITRGAADANYADVRARIDQETAATLRGAEADGENVETHIDALADAMIAAQSAEIASYADAGITVTQAQLWEAEMEASQTLSSDLHARANGSEAYAAFLASLDAVIETRGATAEDRARAETSASTAFRATLEATVNVDADPTVDAAIRSAAALEARAQADATAAILSAGSASGEAMDAGADAATALRADVRTAADAADAARAFDVFSASLRGATSVEGSVLGRYLELDATTSAAVEATLSASAEATEALDASIGAAIDGAVDASGQVDAEALGRSTAAAYADFHEALRLEATTLTTVVGDKEAETTIDLLIVADGSFRSAR